MKTLFAVATMVVFSVAPAFAADGQLSGRSLAKMGLGEMKVISDAQGATIRGQSVVAVRSFSFVTGGTSTNFYFSNGHTFGVSASISVGPGVFASSGAMAVAH